MTRNSENSRCTCDDDLALIEDLGLSPFQHLVLVLTRGVCRGYLTEEVEEWDDVFTIAEQHLGPVDGPTLASACISLMRGVRTDRHGTYNFRPLNCRHVSADEAQLMAVVRAFQENARSCHSAVVNALVDSPEPFRTVIAARSLGVFANSKTATAPKIFQTHAASHTLN